MCKDVCHDDRECVEEMMVIWEGSLYFGVMGTKSGGQDVQRGRN